MIGREVFGYRVEELIGKGSFASVYKVKKWKDTAQQYIRKNSLLMNKEVIDVFKMYTCVKKV